MRFLGEISSMTSDLNQPENHFQDISRTCRKVIGEVKHGHNPKTSISAKSMILSGSLVLVFVFVSLSALSKSFSNFCN